MVSRAIVLLFSLIWCVQSQEISNPKDTPVFLLDLNYVVIEGYHGTMDAKTMELFRNVETLEIRNCSFSVFNENFLHPLKNLQKIIFSHTRFHRVEDDISVCCKKLREVDFLSSTTTPIEEVEFKKLAAMKAVERLNFFRMDVPTLYANALVGSNLNKLEIQYGNLATIEDGALNGMDKLKVLNLQENKLKTIPTASLAAVKTLRELNLKGNLLEKVTTADLPLLPNLEKLNLGHNPVKEIDLTGLKEKLPNIKQVDVSGIDIDLSKADGVPLVKTEVL